MALSSKGKRRSVQRIFQSVGEIHLGWIRAEECHLSDETAENGAGFLAAT
jgi:hypothetical protein